ncbi:MAG: TonB-dependent receptor [Gemmatimonadaceae bacterium]
MRTRVPRPILALFFGATAAAQSDTTRQRTDTVILAPTIVTVTRTPLELSRVPFAVGVTTRDEIQRGKPGFALDEALAGIAGVQVDNRFNYALGERISIRGFGARAQFGVRGVRVILDGIPMTLADGQTSMNNVDVATLARAEVIRGPASALHGNASGGVIQLTSDDAVDDMSRTLGGVLRTDIGAHGLSRQHLSVGGHRDSTAYTVLGSRMFFKGFRQWNTATNDHVGFAIRHRDSRGSLSFTGNWAEYDAKNPGGLNTVLLQANRDTVSPTNRNNQTMERGRQGQLGAAWSQRVADLDVELSVHGLRRQVDNPIPGTVVVIDRDAGGARAALSANPNFTGRKLRVSVGSEVQLQRDDRRNYANSGGARGATTMDQFERVDNTALFLQGTVDVLPRVLALFGVRYDRVRFRVTDHLVDATNPDDSGERTMGAGSPSVGLSLSATRALDLYSNYSTSFETPTTTELANQPSGAGGMNPALDPQRTRSFEVGARQHLNAGPVAGSVQLAAYQARVRDALIPFEVTPGGRQFFQNAGSTKNRGIEAAAHLVFPWSASLRAAFAHTDARFERFSNFTGVHDGKRVPGVAANRGDATLSYQPDWFFVDFETRASSSIPVDNANTQRSPSYVIHGFRAGVRSLPVAGLDLRPTIGILNLFDREYNTSVVVNAFGGRFYEPGPPRSLYGGLIARF